MAYKLAVSFPVFEPAPTEEQDPAYSGWMMPELMVLYHKISGAWEILKYGSTPENPTNNNSCEQLFIQEYDVEGDTIRFDFRTLFISGFSRVVRLQVKIDDVLYLEYQAVLRTSSDPAHIVPGADGDNNCMGYELPRRMYPPPYPTTGNWPADLLAFWGSIPESVELSAANSEGEE